MVSNIYLNDVCKYLKNYQGTFSCDGIKKPNFNNNTQVYYEIRTPYADHFNSMSYQMVFRYFSRCFQNGCFLAKYTNF